MKRLSRILSLSHAIDPERAALASERLPPSLARGSEAFAVASLLWATYPVVGSMLEVCPELASWLVDEGYDVARDRAGLRARLCPPREDGELDAEAVQRRLRRGARDERVRIALREVLPASLGGADVDVTARELSALADVTIEIAFEEALAAMTARFGPPLGRSGAPGRFVVLGMGKLGGEELNAGSDVDLIYFYDTDEGAATNASGESISLHDFWTRVARRLTATLEQVTQDGFVWRVDLRLRPEGQRGPLVNSLAAAERYYESFGRLWERAALLRARPVAGDLRLGEELSALLEPFIWRRRVDPQIATEMMRLVERARAELGSDPARDMKLASGGIREAEFFVQALQLIWGGKEPRVRAKNTLDGLRRLRAAGFVTDREAQEIALGYLSLRRAEHAVQTASGIQTHARPEARPPAERLARTLGFRTSEAFEADIQRRMGQISTRFLSLLPEGAVSSRFPIVFAALDRGDAEGFAEALARAARAAVSGNALDAARGPSPQVSESWTDIARDLLELARHPDAPLGARSREAFAELPDTMIAAVLDAADPEQAARYLRTFFGRLSMPFVYSKLLGDDPRAVRRLVEAFGASAFIGEALANNPELADTLLFAERAPTPAAAAAEVTLSLAEPRDGDDPEQAFVAALRRAKARVTLRVGLADLASEIGVRETTHILSALADAELEAAVRFSLGTPEGEPCRGLAVLAMGKLGGREIGYGSDLDVLFLFDPRAAPPEGDPLTFFTRAARRVIRLISASHGAGPGYELDTRLRPSGSQGLLVTSIEAFARYHGCSAPRVDPDAPASTPHVRAAAWERLALLRARAAAGDAELGAEAMRIAHTATYEMPADFSAVAEEIHRLRMRMERESSLERRGRSDLKLGHGGLCDVEFCAQLLQLKRGADPRVRTTETAEAIDALEAAGYLAPERAETLRDGYAFLRKLEQRIRILHGSSSRLLEENAPGLLPLSRRMGIRDRHGSLATAELIARYRAVTDRVRAAYERIFSEEMGHPVGDAPSL